MILFKLNIDCKDNINFYLNDFQLVITIFKNCKTESKTYLYSLFLLFNINFLQTKITIIILNKKHLTSN